MANTIFARALICCFVFFTGCAHQVLEVNPQYEKQLPDFEKTHHFFFWGWGTQLKVIEPVKVCGEISRVVRVERSIEPIDALYTAISLGIYMPQTTRVFCRK